MKSITLALTLPSPPGEGDRRRASVRLGGACQSPRNADNKAPCRARHVGRDRMLAKIQRPTERQLPVAVAAPRPHQLYRPQKFVLSFHKKF